MAGKQPYIPIYIGDILKDWGHLPLDLFGAAHKLLYRMWDSKQRGKICLDFASYGTLLGVSEMEARKIIGKLTSGDEPIYDHEEEGENIRLINRRMVRETALSKVRSESGVQGGRGKKKQNGATEENFANDLLLKNESKTKAKQKQIPDIDIENESDFESDSTFEKSEKLLDDKSRKAKPEAKATIVLPFDSEDFARHWEWWRQYKHEQFGFRYKSPVSEQAAINDLVQIAEGDEQAAIDIIKQSIAKGWKGFFPVKTETGNGPPPPGGQQRQSVFQANLEANIGAKEILRKMYADQTTNPHG